MGIPIIEFLRDKIYLGAYDEAPKDTSTRAFFTVDDLLPYNNFHHDFGPLSIAHLYRYAVLLHEVLGHEENASKAIVFYSGTDPRLRANAACVLCSYMVLIQSWPPHLALAPVAQAEPPLMPFRDAGYSVADFVLTVQDVVYGVWRAKENGLIDLRSFDLEEYEHYEMVENGDLNEIAPHFVAFASPVQDTTSERGEINASFRSVIRYFKDHNVRLVVRLNSELYDRRVFEKSGIRHIDLIFDDGTCPTMTYVQGFLGAVEGVIAEGGKVAVHCRAGLGRTGCLIGAHLIYTYGFTAQEAIAYMRFLRPGMVVGPQQHWLYLHQNEFRDWRRTMRLSPIGDDSLAGYCPLVPISSRDVSQSLRSPSSQRSPSAAAVTGPPRTPERSILGQVSNAHSALPVPTPGQPRKSPSPAPVRPRAASKYHSAHQNGEVGAVDTNSDAEDDTGVVTSADEDADIPSENDGLHIGRVRTTAGSRSASRAASRSTSRSTSGSQRRTVTEYAQYTQRQFARQLRQASNGTNASITASSARSPQRRVPSSGSNNVDCGSTASPPPFLRRSARVASVHK